MKSKPFCKKKDTSPTDKSVNEVQSDHELFLQAFEKPTQIYRYLRTRHLLNPIFLQRTLYYMKGYMSRSHKNRNSFKINSLLEKAQKKQDSTSDFPGSYLNILYSSFHYKKIEGLVGSGDVAHIDTHILKICHKKRKESSAPLLQASVGAVDVPVNPCDNETRGKLLSISSQHFNSNNGHQVKSYLLVFRVSIVNDQENVCEPVPKRRRLSRGVAHENHENINGIAARPDTDLSKYSSNLHFVSELVVYDRHSRCLLTPGQYEVVLNPVQSDLPINKSSPKKNVSWETLESSGVDVPFEAFHNSPLLKFSLTWSDGGSHQPHSQPKTRSRHLQPLDVALANNSSAKPKPQGVASPEAPQLVLYQFVYNNNSKQQTEARRDFHCPWCLLNCLALYSLLKHLKLCHARFTFTYVPHPKGARIDVALNECYDGSYAGNPQDLVAMPTGFSFSRSGPTRRTPTTAVLVCRPKRPKASLSEFLEQDDNDYELPRSYILGHNRLYHHTITCLPIQPHELDIDSEGEHDSEWVRTKTKMMIDEFSDVNEGEKELMKVWNLHVMKHNFVGDCQLPLACSMFIEEHGIELLKKNLYRNFILHMASLHDFGLVGSGIVYKCILQLQQLIDDESLRKELVQHWNKQKEIFLSKKVKKEKIEGIEPFESWPLGPISTRSQSSAQSK